MSSETVSPGVGGKVSFAVWGSSPHPRKLECSGAKNGCEVNSMARGDWIQIMAEEVIRERGPSTASDIVAHYAERGVRRIPVCRQVTGILTSRIRIFRKTGTCPVRRAILWEVRE